ncbi:hypothetical protein AB0L62_33220 [Nocardia asteroides]|uniref:RNA polymerase sigma factor n=1 Tax=Nocardia asteroides TaxID=1824 RepID=UPI00341BCE16
MQNLELAVTFGPALGYNTDAELVEELTKTGFDGQLVEALERQLWLYGWRVLRGMVRNLSILSVRTALPPMYVSNDDYRSLHDSADLRNDLVIDTLALAVPFMIAQLRNGRWQPEKSRSTDPKLGSYFVTACAMKFRDAYKAWHRRRIVEARELLVAPEHHVALGNAWDSFAVVADRFRLRQIIKSASLEERVIVAGLLADKSHAEIAEELGLTVRGVEGRLYRLRQNVWEDLGVKPGRRRRRK